ncbi:stage II sporulation protein R [Mycoplasmatota bacterium WC44]
MRYFLLFSIISIVFLQLKQFDNQFKSTSDDLRLRVIANSNSDEDQLVKTKIVEELLKVYNEVGNNSQVFTSNDNNLIKVVINTVTDYNQEYDIKVGINEFPAKTIDGHLFESGKYESIVITIGEGKGDNYWCILYPDAVKSGEEIEYKLYFVEKLRGIFNADI